MKKVLFVTPDFYPNSTGFSNASQGLINSIIEFGKSEYQIFVYTNVSLGNSKEFQNATIIRRPYRKHPLENRITYKFFARKRYENFKKIVTDNSIDIIFFETNTFSYLQYWTLEDYKEKVFVRIHSTADTEVPVFDLSKSVYHKKNKNLVYKFMQNVSNIVSTSTYYLDFIKHHFLLDNVYMIWNDKSYGLLFNTVADACKEIHPIIQNTFLTMGKMSENGLTQKGMTDLLDSIYYLKEARELPDDFNLIIMGDGVKLPFVKNYIKVLELESFVTIVKKATHDKVFEYMRQSKSVILLSRYEGQSMFITESISQGKPIILSDNNGMQDLIVDNKNGYIVKTGDVLDASRAIKRMISLSEEEIAEFCRESLEIYKKGYTPQAVYKQFDNIIKLRTVQ